MTDREQLRVIAAVAARICRAKQRELLMAEEQLSLALDAAEMAVAEANAWAECAIEAARRYAASSPDEPGIRVESWRRPQEGDAA